MQRNQLSCLYDVSLKPAKECIFVVEMIEKLMMLCCCIKIVYEKVLISALKTRIICLLLGSHDQMPKRYKAKSSG